MRLTRTLALAFLSALAPCLLVGPGAVRAVADVVHLSDGKTIEGKTEDLGGKVRIVTVTGAVITLPKEIIVQVEKTPDPNITYLRMLLKVKGTDAEGFYQLALWCDEHRLSDQYAAMLNKTIEVNPDHAQAKKLLYVYNKFGRPLPDAEAAAQGMLAQFGPSFKICKTPHYLICHDCDDVFVQTRGRLFEKVYERFYRYFEGKGFTLDVINERLRAVLFNTQEEYARMAPGGGGHAGIYSHATNCVYFYDAVNDLRSQEQANPLLSGPTGADRQANAERQRRLAYMARQMADQNISVTVHEATHQLSFNLRLLEPFVDNPTWVVEGLACYFEPPTGGGWEGPGRVDTNRLYFYRKGQYPLSLMNSLNAGGRGASLSLEGYFNAWALTYYLLQERPKDFADYLRRLRAKRPGVSVSAPEMQADFMACFGSDVGKLNEALVAYIKHVR